MPLRGKRLLVVDAGDELLSALAAGAASFGASLSQCRGGRAALEVLSAAGADAAIVDLPLPDVRGDAFLLALRERGVPCIAVSAVLRGERYAEIARGFGAAGFFERPFRVEEALGTLARAMPSSATPTPTPASTPSRTPLPPDREAGPTPADPDFDSLIFSVARPALDETSPGIALRPARKTGFALPLPVAALPPSRPPGAPAMPTGDLAAARLPRLLAALYAGRVTGALTLVRGAAKKLIGLEAGRPVFAVSNVPSERFAARAVEAGLLSAEALRALIAEIRPEGRISEALVARGLLDPARRAAMIADQIRDVIWSAFSWADGTYRLLEGPFARRDLVPVDLAPGALVLEGRRRTGTIESLRVELPPTLSLAPGPAPAVALEEVQLAPAEALVLANADGTKTVSDLVALGSLPERDALALLQGCRDLGILVEVPRLLAGTRRIGFM